MAKRMEEKGKKISLPLCREMGYSKEENREEGPL